MEKSIKNPFAEGVWPDADVVVNVEGYSLHLHSQILCTCSPVFKAMLSGNFAEGHSKKIELKKKKAKEIIKMFTFFYPSLDATIDDIKYQHEEMLNLCREYDMIWLKDRIERYLLNLSPSDSDEDDAIYYIYLGERFDLEELKEKFLEHPFKESFVFIKENKHFKKLQRSSEALILQEKLKQTLPGTYFTNKNYARSKNNNEKTAMVDFVLTLIKGVKEKS